MLAVCMLVGVVNVCLDHLKFCVLCIMVEGMSVIVNVMLSLMSVMNPLTAFCNLSVCTMGGQVMCFGSFCFRGDLEFLKCDDICMCVVNN